MQRNSSIAILPPSSQDLIVNIVRRKVALLFFALLTLALQAQETKTKIPIEYWATCERLEMSLLHSDDGGNFLPVLFSLERLSDGSYQVASIPPIKGYTVLTKTDMKPVRIMAAPEAIQILQRIGKLTTKVESEPQPLKELWAFFQSNPSAEAKRQYEKEHPEVIRRLKEVTAGGRTSLHVQLVTSDQEDHRLSTDDATKWQKDVIELATDIVGAEWLKQPKVNR